MKSKRVRLGNNKMSFSVFKTNGTLLTNEFFTYFDAVGQLECLQLQSTTLNSSPSE